MSLVVTVNLKNAVNLAGGALVNCLDASQNYLPCFDIFIDRDYRAFQTFNVMSHNIGRWWDAILRVEEAIGFKIPGHIEAAMLENTRQFFDNPDHLCLFPIDGPWHPNTARFFLEFHSMREWLLALNALVRYRDSDWARDKGHRMLETIYRISKTDDEPWDVESLVRLKLVEERDLPGARGTLNRSQLDVGRFIEALVRFYDTSGDSLAMELADRFARYHLEHSTNPDGSLNTDCWVNHTHSYLGTLRGLLLFGEHTNQREYIERVEATYRETVRGLFKPSGYVCHDMDKESGGDTASYGDAAQLALWLARHGHEDLLDDAEKMVRNRLVPSQLTECPTLKPHELKKTDDGSAFLVYNNVSQTEREIPIEAISWQEGFEERVIGAFSIHHEPHGGKHAVTDVTASATHALCDLYNHITVETPAGLVVNFHMDYEDEKISVASKRDEEAEVKINVKDRTAMLLRIPDWVPSNSVSFRLNDEPANPVRAGQFATFGGDCFPGEIHLRYELPRRESKETIMGIEYEYSWRGDEIVGVHPNTEHFPFYPSLNAVS